MSKQPDTDRPDVVLIVADDMGYSDIGSFGGEIATPHLDALAAGGLRMTQFYNTARCSPSRASLLTGLHPHQTGIGVLTDDDGPRGYPGTINDRCVTIAEVLGAAGYATYMSGKWHLTGRLHEPDPAWPTRRGFDHFYGILDGAASYYRPKSLTRDETNIEDEADQEQGFYLTTAIGRNAADYIATHCAQRPDENFLAYVAFTAPHWPLHAPEPVVEHYHGRYAAGWDDLREARYRRQVDAGIVPPSFAMSERDPEVPAWAQTPDKGWQERRMEVYAAQVELLDAEVGRIVAALERAGRRQNTMFLFISDNGGCAEELRPGWADEGLDVPVAARSRTLDGRRVRSGNEAGTVPGGDDTFASYGKPWANLSNTPFREYKHWVHEGGIATPLIVAWPAGVSAGSLSHVPHQLPDVMATVLDAVGVAYPDQFAGHDILPAEGASMLGTWAGEPADATRALYWEHEGNAAVRRGRWKLVRKYPAQWELYDMDLDRTELRDRSTQHPDIVSAMSADYAVWATRCGVVPRDQILGIGG